MGKKRNKPHNPVARELRERGPKEQTIRNKREKLREREAQKEMMDWYQFLEDDYDE